MRVVHLGDYHGYQGHQGLDGTIDSVLEKFINAVPDQVDKTLGTNSEAEAVKTSGGLLGNPAATKYVNDVGQTLVKKSKRPGFGYKFDIVRDPQPNAFALPNGSIFATLGLLRMLKNESELANVLGHEVTHVTERHTMKQVAVNATSDIGTTGLFALISAISGGTLNDDQKNYGKELVGGLVQSGYSRENEAEADKIGQGVAASSGWNPHGMIEVMQGFQSLEKTKPEGIKAYMQSHPYAGERVKAAEDRLPALTSANPQAQDVGQDRYKAFMAEVEKTAPPPPATAVAGRYPGFAAQGGAASVASFFTENWTVTKIAGVSLMGAGLLGVLYLLFRGKKD